jgi:hypothetical protein
MARQKLSRNAPCPCGSGRKYKHCCWGKAFDWVRVGQGQPAREIPLSAEALALLEGQRQRVRARQGREPDPEDLLFAGAPPPEQVGHQIAEAMKRAGLDPALVFAFEQTGLLVTEENEHLIPEQDLRVWHAAVARYRAGNPPPP